MKKTLLITGAAGFIGSSFVRLARSKGYNTVILDALTYAGNPENLVGVVGAELVIGNINDRTLVDSLLYQHYPIAMVNFAAESHVDNSIAKPEEFVITNINGTYTLLEASRKYTETNPNFRFVHISTDEVFGSLGEKGMFNEASSYTPNSPYSASKAAADHLVRAWHHTYGLNTIVTHCGNNYGPRQLPEKLIPVIITRALAGEALPVYGDGLNVRDWIHVEDHCAGILLALEKGRAGEHYCFSGNSELKNIDLVKIICEYLDQKHPLVAGSYSNQITFVPDRLGHDRRYAVDDSKSRNELGFSCAWSFQEGLRTTIDWYLDNTDWCEIIKRKQCK